MKREYRLTSTLIEGREEAARARCDRLNAAASPYQRRNHPAHYCPYTIPDNYGPGRPWQGWIVWHYYKNW